MTLDLASTSDSGSSNTDNLTNDTTPTITGHTDIPFLESHYLRWFNTRWTRGIRCFWPI
ncbi:Ig-like domain-containing protein [Vibrio lentus]|nr:Ig-like domain-containing protein [Vibrio lentus]